MFKDLLEKFRELNLTKGTYVVFGSGPMAVRGLKESNDIDAIVSKDDYDRLKSEGWEEKDLGGLNVIVNEDIELGTGWWPKGRWNVEKIIEEAEEIDGLMFAPLERVLEWKKEMNRPKDGADIKVIKEYLGK